MKVSSVSKKKFWLEYGLASLVFLLMTLPFFQKIPMSESVFFWAEADSWAKVFQNAWHPPVYLILLRLSRLLSGGAFWGGYLPGFISVLISAGLILKLTNRGSLAWTRGSRFMLIAAYLALPAVMQGIFILDIDQTLLTPILLWLTLTGFNWMKNRRFSDLLKLGMILLLALWTKMTTPMLWMGAFGLYLLLIKEWRMAFLQISPLFLTVLILFMISYGWLYADWVLEGYGAFQFSGGKSLSFLQGRNTFQLNLRDLIFSVGSNLGALLAWGSLLLGCAVVLLIPRWFRGLNSLERFSLLFSVIILLTYTLILKVQATAGFPKYHYPMYSFMFVTGSGFLLKAQIRWNRWHLFLFLAVVGIWWLLFGDPLLDFYSLGRSRQLIALAGVLILQVGILAVLLLGGFWWFRKAKTSLEWTGILLIVMLGSSLGGWLPRMQADYATNYFYGVRGTEETVEKVSLLPPEASVYFPFGGLFLENREKLTAYGDIRGQDYARPETDFLVMSKHVLDSGVWFFKRDYVEQRYHLRETLKDYEIWEKSSE